MTGDEFRGMVQMSDQDAAEEMGRLLQEREQEIVAQAKRQVAAGDPVYSVPAAFGDAAFRASAIVADGLLSVIAGLDIAQRITSEAEQTGVIGERMEATVDILSGLMEVCAGYLRATATATPSVPVPVDQSLLHRLPFDAPCA